MSADKVCKCVEVVARCDKIVAAIRGAQTSFNETWTPMSYYNGPKPPAGKRSHADALTEERPRVRQKLLHAMGPEKFVGPDGEILQNVASRRARPDGSFDPNAVPDRQGLLPKGSRIAIKSRTIHGGKEYALFESDCPRWVLAEGLPSCFAFEQDSDTPTLILECGSYDEALREAIAVSERACARLAEAVHKLLHD